MEKPAVLGVDIGGSHITAALVDLKTGTLIEKSIKRNAVNSKQEKEAILKAWCNVIEAAFASANGNEKYIGIAMPGPFDYENGISLIKEQDKFNALYLVNIKEELAKRLQLKPTAIHFMNDAAGFMQGEVFSGAAKGHSRVLGLTLGTGLGSALSINGAASDAELWDSAFLDGIAEDYLSTRWFVGRYNELTGKSLDGVKELAGLVAADALAKQVFVEFGANLAQFLAPIIKKHDAEVVILGGNIAQAFDLFALSLNIGLSKQGLNIPIKLTELNEHAALIGAASNWNLEIHQTEK
ncbi:ROK family protein [Pedobacter sp. KR3-3]|uniref:ROK family protein n=1 Tax=Pedobacter albus TaxID=3113905 RepID=A0ABU7I752_9SPHI|nr:ROK family protein [Pedobacter sp. KR3-3]MEE1945303.1 ROK family protein [Pedobacter sp. KR3-3]